MSSQSSQSLHDSSASSPAPSQSRRRSIRQEFFPSLFGRDNPSLGVQKSRNFDTDTFTPALPEAAPAHALPRSAITESGVLALPTYDDAAEPPQYGHHAFHHRVDEQGRPLHQPTNNTTMMPRRTASEEKAYLSALSAWAKDKDSMKVGDGTFYSGGPGGMGGDPLGMLVTAVDTDQQIIDTTVHKKQKDGTVKVSEGKSKDRFVDDGRDEELGFRAKMRRLSHFGKGKGKHED
jgi:hypothetical protein